MFDLFGAVKSAKTASFGLTGLSEEKINSALNLSARRLRENSEYIVRENLKDVVCAKETGKSESFIDRLTLNEKIIDGIAEGIEQVATLVSPVGKTEYSYVNEFQGISVEKKKVPFGLIGMIYEARPNVTADAFALAFKTRNAIVLKGGKEAINSNKAIVTVIKRSLEEQGVDKNAVTLIEDCSRETTLKFVKMNKYVDLLIPRGSQSLIKFAVEQSTIPIIETGTGNCHVYIDEFADFAKAVNIVFNAKTQRYSVCNACESIVVHEKILKEVLPLLYKKLSEKQVEMRLDAESYEILKGEENVCLANEEDFYTEYGDAIISVKTVSDINRAIEHINEHSTRHSESIVTENEKNAKLFQEKIDSSCVYVNASTRFSDGFVFGLGAEIGISTQKLHARGPMGLDALLTTKYYVSDISGLGAVRK